MHGYLIPMNCNWHAWYEIVHGFVGWWCCDMEMWILLVKEFQGKLLVVVVSVYLDIGDV